MGNCNTTKDCDEGSDLKEIKVVKNKVQVMTFAGPEAIQVECPKLAQPTFSDPVFFSPMNKNKESFKLD